MYIECMYAFCDAVLASPNRRTWHAPLIISTTVVVAILFWKMTCTCQRKMMYSIHVLELHSWCTYSTGLQAHGVTLWITHVRIDSVSSSSRYTGLNEQHAGQGPKLGHYGQQLQTVAHVTNLAKLIAVPAASLKDGTELAPCMSSDPLTSFSWPLFMCRPQLVYVRVCRGSRTGTRDA